MHNRSNMSAMFQRSCMGHCTENLTYAYTGKQGEENWSRKPAQRSSRVYDMLDYFSLPQMGEAG